MHGASRLPEPYARAAPSPRPPTASKFGKAPPAEIDIQVVTEFHSEGIPVNDNIHLFIKTLLQSCMHIAW